MRRALTTLGALALLALALASPAAAQFGWKDLDVTFQDAKGNPQTQAGSHPFEMKTTLGVNTLVVPGGAIDPKTNKPVDGEVPDGELRDLTVAQIPGFIGDQTAIAQCTAAEFAKRTEGYAACPDDSAVGIAAIKGEFSVFPAGEEVFLHLPIYNLVPPPGVAAQFGFVAANVPVTFDVVLSESFPYNLVVKLRNIPQALLFYSSTVTLWGTPANEAHDSLRGTCVGSPVEPTPEPISKGSCPSDATERPLLTLPRSCQGPLETTFEALSWKDQSAFGTATTHDDTDAPLGMTGCGLLGFSPQIKAAPTVSQAESPAGIDVSLEVSDPGLRAPEGKAQSDIKKVVMTLPKGVTANPSAAEGQGVCTKAQYEAASLASPGCPESAKLGSVEVVSPLLAEPLSGALFLAAPDDPATATPGEENPFDTLIALYIVIRSAKYGISITQAGKVVPDEATGQLVSTFDDIPQLPFSRFNLHFREGPRAPLATPGLCGTYTSDALLYPWADPEDPVPATSSFSVTSGPGAGPCPAGVPPFAPGFEAGSLNNAAGAYSPFYMRLTRRDGEQDMTRFDSILPPGVTGKIAGVAKCPDAALALAKSRSGRAEIASPSCPAGSQIGRVLVGAGVGPALTYVPGKIYLAGPFAGDPLSIAVITPAVAGPFDVGTVVVREALTLDPVSAEVQVDGSASDPIPHILKGIPLKLRDLRVFVDRDNFTLNPTSCDPSSVRATLFGSAADVFSPADDAPVALSARYQAANCGALGFAPKLAINLKGGTRRAKFPALTGVLTPRPGDANIGRAVVTLPSSENLEQAHIGTICTRPKFNARECPAASVYGRAKAFTPLLDEPLEGPVYLRANGGERELPDLVADLRGVVDFTLIGYIDAVNARIRTTFATPPDVPVSKFVLEMQGGKKGLLVNNTNICAHRGAQHAKARFTAHNGKVFEARPLVGARCGGKKAAKRSATP